MALPSPNYYGRRKEAKTLPIYTSQLENRERKSKRHTKRMMRVVNTMLRTTATQRSDNFPSSSSLASTPCHLRSEKSSFQRGCGVLRLQNRGKERSYRGKSIVVGVPDRATVLMPAQPSLEEKGYWNDFITYLHNINESVIRFSRPWRYCWVEALEILFEKVRLSHSDLLTGIASIRYIK